MSAAAASAGSVTALVTGANKGIGFHIARLLVKRLGATVYLASRDAERGQRAVAEIRSEFPTATVHLCSLDLSSTSSIEAAAAKLRDIPLDYVINNAGMAFKGDAFDENVARTTLGVNYFGTKQFSEAILPAIKNGGAIINVSSSSGTSALNKMGQTLKQRFLDPKLSVEGLDSLMNKFVVDVAEGTYEQEGWPKQSYGVSKAGLTTLTRLHATKNQDIKHKGILVSAICPGWCRTDMAGPRAPRTAEQGAAVALQLVENRELLQQAHGKLFAESTGPRDY